MSTCNPRSNIVTIAPNYSKIGDTVKVVLSLGAGRIQGGGHVVISRIRFNLDCDSSSLGLNCPDDGLIVSYEGFASNCAVSWTVSHLPGDTLPNQVVFTPSAPIAVPENTTDYCTIEVETKVLSFSNDGTPGMIEQVAGFDPALDAFCDTNPPLPAGRTNVLALRLCPICDDGNQCNGTETCDSAVGCTTGTPLSCDDHDPCTSDSCDGAVQDPANPCVHTPDIERCNDANGCTADKCDPDQGCLHTSLDELPCNDNNDCTSDDVCAAGTCSGTSQALPEVDANLLLAPTEQHGALLQWSDGSGVGPYHVYRGKRMTGIPWSYNEECLIPFVQGNTAEDPLLPGAGECFRYLISRGEGCEESIPGRDSEGAPVPVSHPCE